MEAGETTSNGDETNSDIQTEGEKKVRLYFCFHKWNVQFLWDNVCKIGKAGKKQSD